MIVQGLYRIKRLPRLSSIVGVPLFQPNKSQGLVDQFFHSVRLFTTAPNPTVTEGHLLYSKLPIGGTRPHSARSEHEVTFANIRLGCNLRDDSSSDLSWSGRSLILKTLQNNLSIPKPIIKIGINCLEDLFVAVPETPWIGLELIQAPSEAKPEGLKQRKTELMRCRPGAQNSTSSSGPSIRAPLSVKYSTAWTKPVILDGVTYVLGIDFHTIYRHWPLSLDSISTVASKIVPAQQQKREHLDSFEQDTLFALHSNTIRNVLSGEYADIEDIIHRLALTAFLLNDSKHQIPAIDLVTVNIQVHRQYKSPEEETLVETIRTVAQHIYGNLSMPRESYEQVKRFASDEIPNSNSHIVHVALGSNVGDRLSMIELACKSMEAKNLKVIRTSALYETAPMYLEEQAPFINGVCQFETSLDPSKLLEQLKFIEKDLGRQKTVENGPRPIDLDILLYDDEKVNLEHLTIPHPRISEREFVLKPLCDLIPNSRPPSARLLPTFRDRLEALPKAHPPLSPLTPLSSSVGPLRSEAPDRRTQLMAILNLTPDSFSDGGIHPTEASALITYLENLVSAGVTILDIGGQSSRPHAQDISAEEEIARILPTIKHIRSQSSFDKLVLSIDTYRASVAAAAVEAGANIVNDVSAGTLDTDMLPLVAKLGCTVVLMHMRGTPSTMNRMTSYPTGIIEGVGQELVQRVAAAEAAGIRRWRMILDPGIGFAKNQAQNLELLRRFGELRAYEGLRGIPWVVGASRKGFIGKITGVSEPSERVMGTAATVCAAIQNGADIVRVHDVNEMAQVTKMANAIWRA